MIGAGRFTHDAGSDFFLPCFQVFYHFYRAINGRPLFIAGDQKGDGVRVVGMIIDKAFHRCDHGGEAAFHIRRPPAEQQANLVRNVETNKTRICYRQALQDGGAIGSGAVEGACKHLIQARFKREGMRWKRPGFLNVLALRVARLNGTLGTFWEARSLPSRGAA